MSIELKKSTTKELVEELKTRSNVSVFNYQSHKRIVSTDSIAFEPSGVFVFIKD